MEDRCRICAKPTKKFRTSYLVEKYRKSLETVFDVDIGKDEAAIHPLRFCHSCYNVMKRYEQAVRSGKYYMHQVSVYTWGSRTTVDIEVKRGPKVMSIIQEPYLHTVLNSTHMKKLQRVLGQAGRNLSNG